MGTHGTSKARAWYKKMNTWKIFAGFILSLQSEGITFFLVSGPDRGRSPIEWGDFPFVRTSAHPSPPPLGWLKYQPAGPSQSGLRPSEPSLRSSQPDLKSSQPYLRPGELDPASQAPASQASGSASQEGQRDGQTDGWKISPFYGTSSSIKAAALLLSMKTREELNANTS